MVNCINPYHFVQLSDKPWRGTIESGKKYTGSITYTLKTRSSLFIPNTSSKKAFSYIPDKEDDPHNEHCLYDFFSYETLDEKKIYDNEYFQPVIPGSEVRGMLRSIYETLTNSCLSVFDGKTRIGKRTVEHFEPGILKRQNGRIYLYDLCDRKSRRKNDALYRNRSDFSDKVYQSCDIPDGSKVYFKRNNPSQFFVKPDVTSIMRADGKLPKGYQEGYLLKGNKGPDIASGNNSKCISRDGKKCIMLQNGKCKGKNQKAEHCFLAEKHAAHVFYFPNSGDRMLLNEESIETLKLILDQYLEEDENSYKEYKQAYDAFVKQSADGLPVYYSTLPDSDYVMLSPACITREIYQNTIGTLMKEYKTCNSKERKLCPACQLFGIVNSNIAQGSKIRFGDLLPAIEFSDNKEYYDDQRLTMDPLALPHLQNTEFYLCKPVDPDGEVWFWTYDYYTVKKRDGSIIVKTHQPQISGRKFYWNNLSEIKPCQKQTALNKTVRTVRPGVEFTGTIYFDEISRKQVEQLIHILTYTSDGKHGFKLGTGKSLGLGSVELMIQKPEDINIRAYEDHSYELKHEIKPEEIYKKDFKAVGFDDRVEKSFELITRYLDEKTMRCIRYPKTSEKEDEEGFQWFMQNKENYYYDEKKKKIDEFKTNSSPRFRIQTQIKEALPPLKNGEIPWLSATSADKTTKQKQGQNFGVTGRKEEYTVRIISNSRPGYNPNFPEYDIEVLDDPKYKNKQCKLTAHKRESLRIGDEVKATLYKGTIFNLKRK